VRLSGRELRLRAAEARRHYARCDLCAHLCGVDRRHGPAGVCQEDDGLSLAGAGVHYGEEPQLVPSGLILIAGCNLSCQSCETWSFSLERRGTVRTSAEQLAALLLDLEKSGAANANFVTPTHVLPVLLEALAVAAEHGWSLPVVWNCGGYESIEALRLLEGVVDVYLPDAKYGDDAVAYELSGCKRYTAALDRSLREMHRQAEVIVRHLVLPGAVASPGKLMPLIALGFTRHLHQRPLAIPAGVSRRALPGDRPRRHRAGGERRGRSRAIRWSAQHPRGRETRVMPCPLRRAR